MPGLAISSILPLLDKLARFGQSTLRMLTRKHAMLSDASLRCDRACDLPCVSVSRSKNADASARASEVLDRLTPCKIQHLLNQKHRKPETMLSDIFCQASRQPITAFDLVMGVQPTSAKQAISLYSSCFTSAAAHPSLTELILTYCNSAPHVRQR